MELGIRLHLAGLSYSDTVSELEKFDVTRNRKAVHDWIQRVDLETGEDESPHQVALDETLVKIDGEIYRPYSAVDPATNEILLTRLNSTRTTVLTERFLEELRSKHDVEDATFLVDGAPWPQAALERTGLEYRDETVGDRTAVERVYTEAKRRTSSFEHILRQADSGTAENWLVGHAAWHNSPK